MFVRITAERGEKSLFRSSSSDRQDLQLVRSLPKLSKDDEFLQNLNDLLDEIHPVAEHGPLSSPEIEIPEPKQG